MNERESFESSKLRTMIEVDRTSALVKVPLIMFSSFVALFVVVVSAATLSANLQISTRDTDPTAKTQILNKLAFQNETLNSSLRVRDQLQRSLHDSKPLRSRADQQTNLAASGAAKRVRRRKRQASQQATKQPTTKSQPDVTRVVAVSGQTIEFQCPLASELLELGHANPELSSSSGGGGGSLDQSQLRIIWRKDGQPLSQMNSTRLRLSQQHNSSNLTILQAQSRLDEATYECALEPHHHQPFGHHHQQQQQQQQQPAASSKPDFNLTKVHQFQLKLIVAPRLAPFEFPADAQVGMKVLLTCSALEGQQPISFVWLRDNQIIESADSMTAPRSTDPMAKGRNQAESSRLAVSSLSELHQQQLADKFALSAHSTISLSDQSEYVIIGQGQSTTTATETSATSKRPQQRKLAQELDEDDETAAHGDELGGRRQKAAAMHLADASIRIRQADDYSILSIEPLELKHSARYTCSAQNEAARVSHSSQLIINAPPTLTTEPKDGDLVSGQSITIDCAASGQPRPTLSWLRARESNGGKQWDFVPIYENLRYAILSNGSLAINNVTQREQGFYMCSAKNGFGPEVTKLIKITVHEPARISSRFKLVEARVDEQAQLRCEVEGEPPLTLVWLDREGKRIDKNDKRFIIDDSPAPPQTTPDPGPRRPAATGSSSSSSSSSLIIARAARPDSGHYTCQATNRHGQDKMVINLLVLDVPDKVNELKVTNVTSSTISLRWQLGFTGNAPVGSYLIQYQSDDPLDDLLMSVAKSNQAASTLAAAAVVANSATATSTQPTIGQDSKPPFTRLYDHLFRFGGGGGDKEDKQQQQLQQTSSIKAALETLNSLSATLSDLSITSADEAIDRTLVELTVEQSATSTTIKELSPFCVYRLRLAGINKIGLGEFSDWIRAKTDEAPPSGSALKIAASATGPNSVKLTWFPPDRRSWNGQLVRFQIGYRPIDSTYELNKSIEWSPPSLMQSIMLDVDQNKRKQFQAPPPQTGGHEDNTRGTNSANVTLAGGRMASGPDETASSPYALRQHLRQLLAMQQQELVAHLTNLQRSTTYLVWIQAVNGRGVGPQSHAVSVRTLDDVPPSAPALRVQSSSTNAITIAWSMLTNFLSPANQYSLFYRRVPPPPSSNQVPAQQMTPFRGNSQLFAGTNANRQQLSSANVSVMSTAQMFSDNLAPFSEPGPFLERTIGGQQLVHSNQYHQQQQQSQNQLATGSLAANFRFPATSPNELESNQHHQQFVYTLDQLECGSIYELYMTTRNSVGKSEPSAVVTTRTLGEPPLAPPNKNSLFTRIGAQDVLLNLASWSTGGCPLTHVQVRYKQLPQPISLAATSTTDLANATAAFHSPSSQFSAKSHPSFSVAWPISTSVPSELLDAINHHQQQAAFVAASSPSSSARSYAHLVAAGSETPPPLPQQPTGDHQQAQFALKSLQPSTGYELEIVAHNAAGHTTAQYEFVTAGPNGTRSGYTRREGVFRLDQRGQPIETGEQNALEPSSAFTLDHQLTGSVGHQPFQPSNSTLLQQLVPLVLILLCFICLIISSAFCYHRLAITWKQQRATRRHSIDGFRSICSGGSSNGGGGGGNGGGDESQLAGAKLAGIQNWSRLNGAPSREPQRRLHSELVVDQSPTSVNTSADSPPAPVNEQGFHYCLRESQGAEQHHQMNQQQQQHLMSATLNPKSGFSQSLSMRDFNALPTATLNLAKNGRTLALPKAGAAGDFVKIGATLARGRRTILDTPQAQIPLAEAAHHYGNVLANNTHRACQSSYGPVLNGACKHKLDRIYDLYGPEQQQQHASCNYPLNHHPHAQSLETSWTTTNSALTPATSTSAAAALGDHHHNQLTNYAIPASYQHQIDVALNSDQGQPYSCDELYGQGTIDACIQHLMQQQYQHEQAAAASARQQPPYAMLNRHQNEPNGANQQLQNRCNIYGEPDEGSFQADTTNNNPIQQEQTLDQQQRIGNYNLTATAQSVIESSSGSSGIGMDSLVGGTNQLDSVSATNLNGSNAANNRNYAQHSDQQQQQQQQQTLVTEMGGD